MHATNTPTSAKVSREEIEALVADYCRLAYEKKAMPHGVYEDPFIVCPWPGCGYRITAVDFHIEKMGDQAFYAQVIKAWWIGPGMAGRCPGCGQYVLFSIDKKQAINDPTASGFVVLPNTWHQIAFLT